MDETVSKIVLDDTRGITAIRKVRLFCNSRIFYNVTEKNVDPQIIEDTGILRCRLGLLKTVICLQAIFINRAEMNLLLEKGPEAFSEYLYPHRDDEAHFLCEKTRSEKF